MICGKIAAGKSTLAAQLAEARATILIAEDTWTSTLYPDELKTVADYGKYSRRLRQAMGGHVEGLLRAGLSVVLDFPANTPANREWMRGICTNAGVGHRLHFLDMTDEVCRARMHRRNAAGTHAFVVSDQEFDVITSYFVPPDPSERFDVVVYREGAPAS